MENAIQKIHHRKFGNIRVLILNGKIYFMGRDAAKALGFKDTTRAIRAHVVAEDKIFVKPSDLRVGELPALFPNNGAFFINESGLYSLVLSSKLPLAQEFKHWITSEVIPSIMKTGSYTLENRNFDKVEEAVYTEALTEVREEMNNVFAVEPLLKLLEYTGNQKIRDKIIIKIAEKILGEKLF